MARVAHYLETEPITAIYASPRLRALDSARVVASVQVIDFSPAFRVTGRDAGRLAL
jgi:broad specificity phosphatase PhoE